MKNTQERAGKMSRTPLVALFGLAGYFIWSSTFAEATTALLVSLGG